MVSASCRGAGRQQEKGMRSRVGDQQEGYRKFGRWGGGNTLQATWQIICRE